MGHRERTAYGEEMRLGLDVEKRGDVRNFWRERHEERQEHALE